MRIHNFKINESKNNPKLNVFHHMRRFLTIYSKNDVKKLFGGHIETIIQKPDLTFSWCFHVGNAGSETPFDGHFTIFGNGIYWGVENGGKLAERITSNSDHPYSDRELSIRIFDKRLWLYLWVPDDMYKRKIGKWRRKVFKLNPMDIIFGELRYQYKDLDSFRTTIDMPEDSYPVKITLQEAILKRPRGKKDIKSWCLDVDFDKGIPSHYDKSGGWKGDRTYGFGIDYKPNHIFERWKSDAKNLVTAWVYKERGRTGFTEPQKVG